MLPLAYSVSKSSHAVASTGVIDNETAFIEDFKHISLDESRAVLCVHMLCYVLDGSIGFSEYVLKEQTLTGHQPMCSLTDCHLQVVPVEEVDGPCRKIIPN